ncbi:glycosyltransferase family 2 protein [bacterium]|nr:glycosyltransferase family 2 protein [bacterium]
MKVCIIIPMYNEEHIARKSLETILPYTRKLPPRTKVVVINDCSRDNTEAIVKQVITEQPDDHLGLISHTTNRGYGAANRTGSQYAIEHGYDYVIFMDSDLTNHPKYLTDFYQKMEAGYDYIKATRYSQGGGFEGVPRKRVFVSKWGNRIGQCITGLPITDITNGFRAVKTEVLRNITLQENHFSIIVEELMKARKYTKKMGEIPNILGNRSDQAKDTAFQYNLNTYWKYFKYLFIR